MKIIKALLIVSGITVILVVLSIKAFPEWLAIPGGLLILIGIAFSAVLDAGDKLKSWIELLEGKAKKRIANKLPESLNETNVTSKDQTGGVTAGKIGKLVIQSDKKDIRERVLRVYDKASRLMDKAIKDANDFGIIAERNDRRSRKERKELAFNSKDAFNKYYENNKHYFPLSVRDDIEKLNNSTERCLQILSICFNNMENM